MLHMDTVTFHLCVVFNSKLNSDKIPKQFFLILSLFNLGPLGFTWVKHYCTYDKGTKTFTMSIAETKSGGKVVSL